MKAIYFSPVKIAGQGVVVFFPFHRQSDTGSVAHPEIKTMSERIESGRVKLGGNQTLQPIVQLKITYECLYSVKLGSDECLKKSQNMSETLKSCWWTLLSRKAAIENKIKQLARAYVSIMWWWLFNPLNMFIVSSVSWNTEGMLLKDCPCKVPSKNMNACDYHLDCEACRLDACAHANWICTSL